MKKVVLIALTIIGAGVATSKADASFSFTIGSRHRAPVHVAPPPVYHTPPVVVAPPVCHTPPPPVCHTPPRVVYSPPVYYRGYSRHDWGHRPSYGSYRSSHHRGSHDYAHYDRHDGHGRH